MPNINITSDYEYITNSQRKIIESNIPDTIKVIQDNLLNFEMDFCRGEWYDNELKVIAKELESMARYFLEQHKMGGEIYKSVHAEPSSGGIKFYNDARNPRGQFYAGHIEYGHKGRNGKFVQAFPFMRPALYAVSKASQGSFANILGDLASGVFRNNGKGYQGISNLNFGHDFRKNIKNLNAANNSQASKQHHFTRRGLIEKSKINQKTFMYDILGDSQFRDPFSIRRGRNDKISQRHREDINIGTDRRNNIAKERFKQKVQEAEYKRNLEILPRVHPKK